MALAAWIAASLVLSGLGSLLFEFIKSPIGFWLIGGLLCASGNVLIGRDRDHHFLNQVGLVLLLAGEWMVAFGFVDFFDTRNATIGYAALAVAVFLGIMAALVPNTLHRALATFAMLAALLVAAYDARLLRVFPVLAALFFVVLALGAADSPTRRRLLEPASTGAALALLVLMPLSSLVSHTPDKTHLAALVGRWPEGLMAAGLIVTAALLVKRARVTAPRIRNAALIAAVAFACLAWPVPGLSASLIVLLVAFALGRPVLCGVGVAAILGALVHYYYALDATLLRKSLSLVLAGALLIALGVALSRGWLEGRRA
jgi:hypothetical protein